MLCVVGDLVEDVVVHVATAPARATDTPAVIRRHRGGSAANVAAAAVAAGCPARFIGRVGDDATGAALAAGLSANGVDVRVQRAGRTGTVVVLVEPGGERTMMPDRGAAQQLGAVDPTWLDGVRWLHVPAYSLCAEPIGTATVDVADRARRAGARLSIDVSSVAVVEAFGPARFRALLAELAPQVVMATVTEARTVDGFRPGLLVVKDGGRPIELRAADGHIDRIAVEPVGRVVDTTGAGDAFAGGFVAATMAGAGPIEAARVGGALAARTLGVAGAALEVPE